MWVPGASQKVVPPDLELVASDRLTPGSIRTEPAGWVAGPLRTLEPQMGAGGVDGALDVVVGVVVVGVVVGAVVVGVVVGAVVVEGEVVVGAVVVVVLGGRTGFAASAGEAKTPGRTKARPVRAVSER